MDRRCFYHHYHCYKSHAWCDWSLKDVGFRAELTIGAFTYVKVCIGNFLCACEKSQGWQFLVFIVKFAIFCKPANFWIHCSFLLFSLFCIKFMRIVKNRKGDDFSLLFAIFAVLCYVAHQVESQIWILLILQKILRSMIFWPDKISISSCKFYNSCSYVQTWTCLPSLGVKIRLDFAWWVSTMCLVHILLNHVELLLHF